MSAPATFAQAEAVSPLKTLALQIASGDLSGLPKVENPLWNYADWRSAAEELLHESNPFELDWMLAREECWQRFNTMTLPEGYDFDSFIADRAAWNGPDTVFARARRFTPIRGDVA